MTIGRKDAAVWATWFAAIGDPTRVLILNLLSVSRRPTSVSEITEALDVGQSTVSHHLAKLAEVGFVVVERRGTSSYWQVNDRCLACFPSAAEVVMGRVNSEFTEAIEATEEQL